MAFFRKTRQFLVQLGRRMIFSLFMRDWRKDIALFFIMSRYIQRIEKNRRGFWTNPPTEGDLAAT